MFVKAKILSRITSRALAPLLAIALLLPGGIAQAEGDVVAGEKVFKKCAACHSLDPAAGNKVGPNLHNVIGHHAAMHEGFKYSPAMVEAGAGGLTWTEDQLDKFLESPKELIKGTKMTFVGLKKPEERADVIAYIKSKSDAPTN